MSRIVYDDESIDPSVYGVLRRGKLGFSPSGKPYLSSKGGSITAQDDGSLLAETRRFKGLIYSDKLSGMFEERAVKQGRYRWDYPRSEVSYPASALGLDWPLRERTVADSDILLQKLGRRVQSLFGE